MVEQRHEDVAGVTAHDDVLGLWEEPQTISGQMALNKPVDDAVLRDDRESVGEVP